MAKSEPVSQPKMKKFLNVAIAIILVAATVSSLVFYYLYTKEAKKNAQDDAVHILKAVGKLMELPLDEVPTVATVTDKTKLQDQPLLKKAENGDRIIIYTKAQKAILYRPSKDKIIDIVPVNTISPIPTQAQQKEVVATSSALPSPTNQEVSIIILNGTEKVGLTNQVEASLIKLMPNIKVIDKDNAKDRTYEKTIVVVINEAKKQEAEAIAKLFNAELKDLPDDEKDQSNATDIVIIAGKDRL